MVRVSVLVEAVEKFWCRINGGLIQYKIMTPLSSVSTAQPEVKTYTAMFMNNRGKKIFCKYWEPCQKARALVYIAHGFAEHCLPYDSFAKVLASHNFFVFSHDHVGHGQSGGSRVHIDTFRHYVQDVFQHIDFMKKKFADTPVFLCGHSMGGAISILTALQRPDDFGGVILIGPAVATNSEIVTPFKIALARILRWLSPHFPVGALDYSLACSCPKNVKMMLEDPLRWHGYCKAGFGACLIDATQEIQEKASTITYPFLMLQGEDDKLCDANGAKLLFNKAISTDKSIKIYPKAYHCLLLEPHGIAEEVTEDILQWLLARA